VTLWGLCGYGSGKSYLFDVSWFFSEKAPRFVDLKRFWPLCRIPFLEIIARATCASAPEFFLFAFFRILEKEFTEEVLGTRSFVKYMG